LKAIEVVVVAGARPNFMKVAPLMRAFAARPKQFRATLVHTGQHYDQEMNGVFFDELGIPRPDAFLGAGGGSHGEQTAKVMVAFERHLQNQNALPDWVVVVGDVNSTLACAIVAKKLGIRLAHVEAGLRSGDRRMPEEINRLATDSISDMFFVTEPSGREHLLREGHAEERIRYVGHVMIDNLFYQLERLKKSNPELYSSDPFKRRHVKTGYAVITLHRPSNVDRRESFEQIAKALRELSCDLPMIFPMHPRTRRNAEEFGIDFGPAIQVVGPLSYMDFLHVWRDASLVLTDSGGMQEETTALGVRCVTLRDSTERPVTINEGTNVLAGTDPAEILRAARAALAVPPSSRRPALWDGNAATRIASDLQQFSGH
jgi:UDP-N-acetylglucosamine 2-epimerase (non-hydrolysing)